MPHRALERETERRYCRQQGEASEHVEPAGKAAGVLLGPSNRRRADKAAEIADAIDPGDAGCRGTAGQDHRRESPEWAFRSIEADRRDRHTDDGPRRADG